MLMAPGGAGGKYHPGARSPVESPCVLPRLKHRHIPATGTSASVKGVIYLLDSTSNDKTEVVFPIRTWISSLIPSNPTRCIWRNFPKMPENMILGLTDAANCNTAATAERENLLVARF